MKPLRLFLLAGGLAASASANVTLAPLFQDHAVLQRDLPVPVWGEADPGEHVTVAFKGQQFGTTASADGRWVIYLDALESSAEPASLVVTGKNTVTINDVLVGEVWLASGQSNMEWPVSMSKDAEAEIAAANNPLLRVVKINHQVMTAPASAAPNTGWRLTSPDTVGKFTAIGYFFARDLQRKLGVPVGLIDSTWGGTPIESWMSDEALRGTSAYPAIEARWQKDVAEYPEKLARYTTAMAAFNQALEAAKAAKTKFTLPRPGPLLDPHAQYGLSVLFNGMIAPLQPYALRGVIWYQGEQNWPRPGEYAELFPAMIRSWRAGWGQGDFPFYFVQLAAFGLPGEAPRAWAYLREAQTQALRLRATEMATAIDVGDAKDIHPRNKQEVGRRLALIAKAQTYNIPGDFSGPMFERVVREGSALRVYFSHASTGLISYDKPVQSLEIAGADHQFHAAVGRIERGTLVVSSKDVKDPEAVRYAWSNAPVANLYNGAGLPAPPFRSDVW